ncbi:hypothetical protein BT93_L0410 [Corymbia citriodora subsp. variegata]|uniref:TIR domain-containing protein n=1 Tax=Corymbia citriodora subsp. variegata TaxID=360336 RepID=A0A8T0CU44_CORYI|nr:hypothetical protein BT93_L0410 [Corymbia citriodora subsp. variegata]
MPFLILSGLIVSAVFFVVEKMSGNSAHAAYDSAPDKKDDLALDVEALLDAAGKPEASSTSTPSSRFKYDVYLSLGGADSCNGFADHLNRQLDDAGIRVFNDEYDLTPRKEIGPELKGAIERSRISIVIFSENFAPSSFCLNELVQLWECRKSNGRTIIPIFYDVSPQDVRHRLGTFGEAFFIHREKCRDDSNTMETWKEVLRQSGQLKGFIRDNRKGPEGQFIKEVVARVVQLLKEDYRFVDDKLVGIDHHVQEMMRKLDVTYHEGQATEVQGKEVHVVGICGESGVRKTTLAKAVFCKMCKLFDAHSFLEDIRSEGVQLSRRMLIADLKKQISAPLESSGEGIEEIASSCRDAKVLIVLDGVDKDEQIKALAGKFTWLGPGSRIIVTTNKKNVLKAFDDGAVREHTVKRMDQCHAHKLFCKHAFQGVAPQDVSEYFGLSLDIAKAIGGLPSEIVHQASSLREDMNMTRWETTLELLRKRRKK